MSPTAPSNPRKLDLPDLPYRPQSPAGYNPPLGLIGCGGITRDHLLAYRRAGFRVVGLCDVDRSRAAARRDEFYPDAELYTAARDLLRRDDIEVVDIATHPAVRVTLIREALLAGKHVLSQKPFVLNLDEGERLIELADQRGLVLAVNQNARWAPHFAYARQAVAAGWLGTPMSAHLSVHWDHTPIIAGREFEKIHHVILYDYAIHWFDMLRCLLPGQRAVRVFASNCRHPSQRVAPPLLAQASVEFEQAQATLAFDGCAPHGTQDRTLVTGTHGSLSSRGPDNKRQQLTVTWPIGSWQPQLVGSWFPDGFHGTMGELLCSLEAGRPTEIGAADNLKSLELCFAAVASADAHEPVVPGTIRRLPGSG